MRVYLHPPIEGEDTGEGGVRRVIEGQRRHLPNHGVTLVSRPEDADLIASHITLPPEWLRAWPDKAYVLHSHGLYWAEYDWPKWATDTNRDIWEAVRCADAVTVPSQWLADVVERHSLRKPVVIPHGLDLEEWAPGTNKGYVLWDKTRVDPVCDPQWMQQVARLLPNIQFVSTHGEPANNVAITGHLSFAQAKGLVQSAAVYLATSRETFGIATVQALACGVPVAGFRWGAQPEIVRDGIEGKLATPMNVDELATAIATCMQQRTTMSQAAQLRATDYGWDSAAASYADLYRDVLERRRRTGPRTSIIVTAYNMAPYLAEALDSVLAQKDQDWECIVVDDASPDDSGAIAEQYAQRDPRFRVIHNERNQHTSEAKNIGIRAARGRYILPLDGDDQLTPNAVRGLASALDVDRSLAIVYGNVKFVEQDGKTPIIYRDPANPGHSGWPYQYKWEEHILGRNVLPYSSMFRREVWEATGGYRRRLRNAEDADFWFRAASYGFRPAMVSPSDSLIYRVRPDSLSHREAPVEWARWFPWIKEPARSPAGAAVTGETMLPVTWSLEPTAISVVIPVGAGHERIVVDAVDSVDAQTMRQWECIVVNDSGRELAPLPSWVRIIDTGGGKGVAAARNAGIAASHGAFFVPLDADDYLQPTALETWLKVAERDPMLTLYSDFFEDPTVPNSYQVFACEDWAPEKLLHHSFAAVTQCVPTAVWRAVGGYPEEGPWEDWRFQLRAAAAGFCSARVAQPLFTYRKRTGQRAKANFADRAENIAIIQQEFGRYRDGRETLMACSTCGSRSHAIQEHIVQTLQAERGGNNDMAQVVYTGARDGAVWYKGPSGREYSFDKGDARFLDPRDVEHFLSLPGFQLVQAVDPAAEPTIKSDSPDNAGITPPEQPVAPVAIDIAAPLPEMTDEDKIVLMMNALRITREQAEELVRQAAIAVDGDTENPGVVDEANPTLETSGEGAAVAGEGDPAGASPEPAAAAAEPAAAEDAGWGDLPTSVVDALKAAGFPTLASAKAAPDADLLAITGIGKTTVTKIRAA